MADIIPWIPLAVIILAACVAAEVGWQAVRREAERELRGGRAEGEA